MCSDAHAPAAIRTHTGAQRAIDYATCIVLCTCSNRLKCTIYKKIFFSLINSATCIYEQSRAAAISRASQPAVIITVVVVLGVVVVINWNQTSMCCLHKRALVTYTQ